MTVTQHVEPLVDALIASLRADLNTRITEINAVETDFELPLVASTSYYAGGLSAPSIAYPFVEISASDASYSQPTIRQAAWNRAEATLITALWCRHVDDETLYRSTLRYGRALLAVILKADTFGLEVFTEGVRVAYRRNPDTGETQQLEGCAVIFATIVGDDAGG